jgi:ketosteroid isomerase-like protein
MDRNDPRKTAEAFNACISARDLSGLAALMTDDHRFIDTAGEVFAGKHACVEAWAGFFAAFPDYRNIFERFVVAGWSVAIAGRSACSDSRLDGPALWSADVRSGKVAEWRVHDDTLENRARLGLLG